MNETKRPIHIDGVPVDEWVAHYRSVREKFAVYLLVGDESWSWGPFPRGHRFEVTVPGTYCVTRISPPDPPFDLENGGPFYPLEEQLGQTMRAEEWDILTWESFVPWR